MVALGCTIEPSNYPLGFVFLAAGLYLVPFVRNYSKDKVKRIKLPAFLSKKIEMRQHINAALSDGTLTEEESITLCNKARELNIDVDYIQKVRTEDFNQRIEFIKNEANKTRRLSPHQESQLKEISSNLQIEHTLTGDLKIYRDLWQYENNGQFNLTSISVPIFLKDNEIAYFGAPCSWKQIKTIRNHNGYTSGSVGFSIAKGVNFRIGRAIPTYSEAEKIVPISKGEIYITNKRITFNGDRKSTNITIGRITQLLMWSNGIEIRKTSGKPDFFSMSRTHAEYISALVHNMLNN